MAATTSEKRNEDLRVGDVIRLWCGTKRIVRIELYRGPLADIIFAVAYCEPRVGTLPWGLSLEKGGYTNIEGENE